MITEIKISNFKSVQDLTLPLGQFNVLIGSNGSGKSNILEAIAFGGAASADKLDNEFLGSRGIRTSGSELMRSAFLKNNTESIVFAFKSGGNSIPITINEEKSPIAKWIVKEKEYASDMHVLLLSSILIKDFNQNFYDTPFYKNLSESERNRISEMANALARIPEKNKELNEFTDSDFSEMDSFWDSNPITEYAYKYNKELSDFIIYSPEISSLRKFEEESQIKPLGVKGEGLFNVLQIFYENESYGEETINELRKYLHVIEWFDDFEAVFDKVSGRKSLVVKDRNIPEHSLNQNNVNEGFLFLLFYISLMISKETPAFFAIDNVEASFHPRLCEELIKNLVELSKKHNKQVILTTHNPFVLDGLDLNDPEQKLFVVRRNADGETIADNIDKAPKNVKLSDAWMRGYIGGQPETIE